MEERPDEDGPASRVRGTLRGLFDVHSTATLVVVGVVALVLAGVLGYVTFRDTFTDPATPTAAEPSASPSASPAAEVETRRVVHRRGGFRVAAPEELQVKRERRTLRLASKDKSLVVTVGPSEPGPLKQANRRVIRTLRENYRRFELIATEPMRIDGRPALTTSGLATNSSKVRIRFVVLTVKAKPRNYTIAAYTARDSDPATVLPLVNAVANGFEVLPAGRR